MPKFAAVPQVRILQAGHGLLSQLTRDLDELFRSTCFFAMQ
jgi:hypothetical protein